MYLQVRLHEWELGPSYFWSPWEQREQEVRAEWAPVWLGKDGNNWKSHLLFFGEVLVG